MKLLDRIPNPLATRRGRLLTFCALYVTEGIPTGFTLTAVATQMRRQGVSPEAVGAFVAATYLPWSWKWMAGPIVDVFSSDRLGRRRAWIVGMQLLMVATLLLATPIDFATHLGLFTFLLLVHNMFAATQDVAIDALAVGTLGEDERGLGTGLMFAGSYVGQAIGGAGVLFLVPHIGFRPTYFFVAVAVLLVTLFVALPMRETAGTGRAWGGGSRVRAAARELARFAREAVSSFIGSRPAFLGVFFALLPTGAYALSLALQSNLAVELGMPDSDVATLSFWSTVLAALGCVLGGWASDRFGRRRMLSISIVLTTLPTIYLAWQLHLHGWLVPVDPTLADRPLAPPALLQTFWVATLVYAVFQGFIYGTWTAIFIDVTNPAVAATQFTAYMALSNLAIAYSAAWQGQAVGVWRWSYPVTLFVDCILGLVGLAFLAFMKARGTGRGAPRTPAFDPAP